jgi:hypothetical protein
LKYKRKKEKTRRAILSSSKEYKALKYKDFIGLF